MQNYNYAVIRKLVEAAFNDEDLQIFCYDHFSSVAEQFTTGQTKRARDQMLIDYVGRHGLTDRLLDEIRAANPYQYEEFRYSLRKDIHETPSGDSYPNYNHTKSETIINCFSKVSNSLLNWPTTLGNNRWLERPELKILTDRIESDEKSTTLLLGMPGTGKSALLAVLGHKLNEKGIPVLAIKADMLPSSVSDPDKLKTKLQLPFSVDMCLKFVAEYSGKAVLIVDQLDAISELADRKSERLNVLLDLIHGISSLKGIHIVSSSRWFEYKHDVRLTTISSEQLELTPLSWEQVQTEFGEAGITERNWSQEAQNLLRIPLHLKLFLYLRTDNPSIELSVSLQGLLQAIWEKSVLNQYEIAGKNNFINQITQKMAENEELWISKALVDENLEVLESLLCDEILVPDETNLRIGFRHQTYFDFARARYFTQAREILSNHVLERQDGLFIRPILLSTLEYMRNAAPAAYHRELMLLWENQNLRSHLRTLLLEYLAALDRPDEQEIQFLLPVLKDNAMMHRALITMAGSRGWFNVIKETHLPDFMSKEPETGRSCVSLLIQALSFDRTGVLKLIQNYWLPDKCYDHMTLRVLSNLGDWDEEAVNMVCVVARRSEQRWDITYIAEIVSQSNPNLAPKIVRADLDRRLIKAEQEDNKFVAPPRPSPDANQVDHEMYYMINDPLKKQKQLLETDLEWRELSIIAERAPGAFLELVWPWFLKVLERIAHDEHKFITGYRDDYSLGTTLDGDHDPEHEPVNALKDAIVRLAESDPATFSDFLKQNKNSSLLSVHRLLCRGLQKIAPEFPETVYEYLTSDPRRLVIGDVSNCHCETVNLITIVAPHLSEDNLIKLEKTVLEWNRYYKREETWTPGERFERQKRIREHRLRLLRVFPEDYLSEETKRIREQEERAFPDLQDWDSGFSSEMHEVGSPMKADQMKRAKDEDIINLFEELDDSTEWDHPRHKWKEGKSVGGVIQASHELNSFAEKEPERAVKLVHNFKPGQQEIPAGAVLQGLSKSTFSSEELFSLVKHLVAKGFSSESFRGDVAQVLKTRANKDQGLPDAMLQLMESWLPTYLYPSMDQIQKKRDYDDYSNKLYIAIAKGYLSRQPSDIHGWGKIIERAIDYEKHPDIWKVIMMYMPDLFNGDKIFASHLYDQVLTKFGHAVENRLSICSIAKIIHLVSDPSIVHKWLTLIQDRDWVLGQQAFGELAIYYLCWKQDDTWVEEQIWNAVENPEAHGAHRGIAFGAVNNWHSKQCQKICTSVIIALTDSDDKIVQKALSQIFQYGEQVVLNDEMKKIIEAILPNDGIILNSAESLIEGTESATSAEPELVSRICNRFLDAGMEEIKNITTSFAMLAEPLVSISLTLHRMPPYREAGLNLFERLVESNIQEASQALDMLDRKLISNVSRPAPRRKRRRRSSLIFPDYQTCVK
ncbi:MAG: ATP-binding protein [Desulfobacterales bacterium]|nr:ATP-binding protein [Desulfobacterales bacterium]